jgi:hypothetical protein
MIVDFFTRGSTSSQVHPSSSALTSSCHHLHSSSKSSYIYLYFCYPRPPTLHWDTKSSLLLRLTCLGHLTLRRFTVATKQAQKILLVPTCIISKSGRELVTSKTHTAHQQDLFWPQCAQCFESAFQSDYLKCCCFLSVFLVHVSCVLCIVTL